MLKDMFVRRKYGTLKLSGNEAESKIIEVKTNDNDNDNAVATDEVINNELFIKCTGCGEIIIKSEQQEALNVCPKCNKHFRIDSLTRITYTFDNDNVEYFDTDMKSLNPLNFQGYSEKTKSLRKELGINDGVVTGIGTINGYKTCFGVMDSRFIMGSMGSVVGEKLTRMFEKAIELALPAVVFTVSGGARMQEGMISLSQMAKVSAAVKKHSKAGLLYITVLTDPTTGGVTASFASLGDIILAEPGATIGFAGKRVIEQTIRQKLPDSFQSSEFLLEHGFIDMIVSRKELKETLAQLLILHGGEKAFE